MPNTTTLVLVERKTVARDLAHTLTTGGVLDQPLSSALRFAASTTCLLSIYALIFGKTRICQNMLLSTTVSTRQSNRQRRRTRFHSSSRQTQVASLLRWIYGRLQTSTP